MNSLTFVHTCRNHQSLYDNKNNILGLYAQLLQFIVKIERHRSTINMKTLVLFLGIAGDVKIKTL